MRPVGIAAEPERAAAEAALPGQAVHGPAERACPRHVVPEGLDRTSITDPFSTAISAYGPQKRARTP